MLRLITPKYEELEFRQKMMADEATMSYNHAWGGTIDWPKDKWEDWYDYWITDSEGERFYRYLQNEETGEYVGEIAYHFDGEHYIADVVVHAKYRGKGFGREGLRLLCEEAKANGIEALYDDIAIDNPAVRMFLGAGFVEEFRTEEIIMVKKDL